MSLCLVSVCWHGELAQSCWWWYHTARHYFCDQSHTVVIGFDIMYVPILSVSLPLFNEVWCYFIEWRYFNIIIAEFFLFKGKHLLYLKFWGNLFWLIYFFFLTRETISSDWFLFLLSNYHYFSYTFIVNLMSNPTSSCRKWLQIV